MKIHVSHYREPRYFCFGFSVSSDALCLDLIFGHIDIVWRKSR